MTREIVIKKHASDFRQKFGLNNIEPIKIKNILTRLSILTIFKTLQGNISGISLKVNNNRYILVNSEDTLGKQHFTICHELYHLFIEHDFQSTICTGHLFNRKSGIEYDADRFAAYLLLPEDGVLSMIPEEETKKNSISLSTVVKIEQFYGCSRTALLYRLKSLGLITSEEYEIFNKNIKLSALLNGYNTKLYEKGHELEIIGDYGEKARRLFDNEKISESHYLTLLKDIGIEIPEMNE